MKQSENESRQRSDAIVSAANSYDVAIIGGGPAGLSVAIAAAGIGAVAAVAIHHSLLPDGQRL